MRIFLVVSLSIAVLSCKKQNTVKVCFNKDSKVMGYGIARLEKTLDNNAYHLKTCAHHKHPLENSVVFSFDDRTDHQFIDSAVVSQSSSKGFSIQKEENHIIVYAKDEKGALYGTMEIIEQLENQVNFQDIIPTNISPAFSFRAIKFNLPWSPYRPGPATDLHMETCRDLKFWEAFLDMMVENRFNALTLWNTHPFPYMIRAVNYPKATPFNDQELEEWKAFWKSLFNMAKTRGIETYIVNWNIVVSPEFAEAYGAKIHFDRSELVKKYTKESVTQTINEYEDLTGIGVTLADWMGNWGDLKMSPSEREAWIRDTFVDGMNAANRKVKFIHRAVLAGDPKEMRHVIDYADLPDKTIVEVKFNWSHGHSTPHLSLTHSNDAGTIMRDFWDPQPENYFISWMIRNEDFFVLRWGDPDFIRSHISTNDHTYVDGYFIGSEGYIPAVDYAHNDSLAKTWKYAFQKQWMYYHLWGNLLYNPKSTNEMLANKIKKKHPDVDALSLLKAYTVASKVPQAIASFYKGTWDFTLYSEGFLAPWQNGFDDEKSPFISLEELINHETLDSRYINIKDFSDLLSVNGVIEKELITPIELADSIIALGETLEDIIVKIRAASTDPTLQSELDDLETWRHLGYYFADKISAGVAYSDFLRSKNEQMKEQAVSHLEQCLAHWKKVIELTEHRYKSMPYVSMGHHEQKWPDFQEFHWKHFLVDVEADLEFVKNKK